MRSYKSIQIIARRHEARQYGNFDLEWKLSVDIKRSVNDDRARWLEDLLTTGLGTGPKIAQRVLPEKGSLVVKNG